MSENRSQNISATVTGDDASGQRDDVRPQAIEKARGGIVVTEETLSANVEKPRIPNVCNALDLRCVNLVGFVKDQGWTF